MAVNYFGPVALTKALLPSWLERGHGHFVVVSSLVGRIGSPFRSGYAASKHAFHGFFDSLRAEVAERGLHVTIVCPGFVQTEISLNALTGDGTAQGRMDEATAGGITAEACAKAIVGATARRRVEITVGGFERAGVWLERLSPALFARVLQRAKVT
jgi:short-subunit dehydrogenase